VQVTKAALYYHFRTKEDILRGTFEDMASSVDELVAWGRAQPRTVETRREVLRRYAAVLGGQWRFIVQFLQENQPAMRELDVQSQLTGRFSGMVELLRDPEGDLTDRFRAFLAVVVLHLGVVGGQPGPLSAMGLTPLGTEDEVAAAALDVAFDLVSGRPHGTAADVGSLLDSSPDSRDEA
jgi:AcrR family transcriptional regulator